ncbi:MAG: tryptophan--tRNA ligase [Planctomycetota bacterium]|nr:tryptophan--tRNA ligase [Planctomycetota bacterium]
MGLRILSGVQPSGDIHLGNYFGAIKQHIEYQDLAGAEPYYFIADFHAMTTVQNAAQMRQNVEQVALDYLALGLDPQRSVFFRQSDVPEVTELAWMLGCVTGMGLLERAHSYKDKLAKGIKASVGLFYYPVLMAADILIYKANLVPVGQDQVQHVEMTQDMAQSFNHAFSCEALVRPEAKLNESAKVPGVDGEKMSKSYGNSIPLTLEGKELKKRVMSIKTDSTPVEAPKNPDTCNVFALYKLVASPEEASALAERYKAGGMGYGDAKNALLEKLDEFFQPYRETRKDLARNMDYVNKVLADGAARARQVARQTLDECKKASGLG